MSEHTPGPYRYTEGRIINDKGVVVAWTFDENGNPLCGPSWRRAKPENFKKGVAKADANGCFLADAPRLAALNAELVAALKDAHEAIDALLHAEQNPDNARIGDKASDALWKARKSKRAVLKAAKEKS